MISKYNDFFDNQIIELGKELDINYKVSNNLNYKYLLYIEDALLLGFISYSILYEKYEVIDIVVKLEYRNKGIGSKLIEELVRISEKSKCENITLEVNENNKTAISFYKMHGFKTVAIRKNYYKNSNALLLERVLEVIN